MLCAPPILPVLTSTPWVLLSYVWVWPHGPCLSMQTWHFSLLLGMQCSYRRWPWLLITLLFLSFLQGFIPHHFTKKLLEKPGPGLRAFCALSSPPKGSWTPPLHDHYNQGCLWPLHPQGALQWPHAAPLLTAQPMMRLWQLSASSSHCSRLRRAGLHFGGLSPLPCVWPFIHCPCPHQGCFSIAAVQGPACCCCRRLQGLCKPHYHTWHAYGPHLTH